MYTIVKEERENYCILIIIMGDQEWTDSGC